MQILLSSDTYGALDAIMFFAGLFRHLGVLFVSILSLVAYVKIYMKMGEPWWTAIIPIYSGYVLASKIKALREFWLTVAVTAVFLLFFTLTFAMAMTARDRYTGTSALLMMGLLLLIYIVVQLIINYLFYYKLAKAFGQNHAFAIGLVFLRPIFSMLLAFGSYDYIEENKKDFVEEFKTDNI